MTTPPVPPPPPAPLPAAPPAPAAPLDPAEMLAPPAPVRRRLDQLWSATTASLGTLVVLAGLGGLSVWVYLLGLALLGWAVILPVHARHGQERPHPWRRSALTAALVVTVGLSAPLAAQAARDASVTAGTLWTAPLPEAWTRPAILATTGSAAVVGVTGEPPLVLDLGTGEVVPVPAVGRLYVPAPERQSWRPSSRSPGEHPGAVVVPVGEATFTMLTDSALATFTAEGTLLWERPTERGSTLVAVSRAGTTVVRSPAGATAGPGLPALVARDREGDVVWTSDATALPTLAPDPTSGHSAPVPTTLLVADLAAPVGRVLDAATGDTLVADVPEDAAVLLTEDAAVVVSPAGDESATATAYRGTEVLWQRTGLLPVDVAEVHGERAYLGSLGRPPLVYDTALDLVTGRADAVVVPSGLGWALTERSRVTLRASSVASGARLTTVSREPVGEHALWHAQEDVRGIGRESPWTTARTVVTQTTPSTLNPYDAAHADELRQVTVRDARSGDVLDSRPLVDAVVDVAEIDEGRLLVLTAGSAMLLDLS